MPLQLLENIFIACIVATQLMLFFRVLQSIRDSKYCIPAITQFFVKRVQVEKALLQDKDTLKVLEQANTLPHTEERLGKGMMRLELITSQETNATLSPILLSLNTYLLRNRGSAADFNLIKDIIERHTDALDKDINLALPLPLYLGLMGTMIGIVLGLFGMPDVSNLANDTQGIDVLIGGVKVAMIASFTGLGLTVISSGYFYKGSKALVEKRKNDLYTFLQTELLPVLSQNVNSGIIGLNKTFEKFIHTFQTKLSDLQGIVGQNHETLALQQEVLKTLEKIDPAVIAKNNLIMYQGLQKNVENLEKLSGNTEQLNAWLTQLNEFIAHTSRLNQNMGKVLEKEEDVQAIASGIRGILEDAKAQQRFLESHFSDLQNRETVVQRGLANVDDALDKTFKGFLKYDDERQAAFKRKNEEWDVMMEDALKQKSKSLSKLDLLENINDQFTGFYAAQQDTSQQIIALKESLEKSNKDLIKAVRGIQVKRSDVRLPKWMIRFLDWLKSLFRGR